ncbi:hypothetical protein EVAR_30563_1 [Eumeta japonica]|uniref:Uncharacterized protein n=1 Tax=Eumeta variegata TaxID=151549 RepID=A0A4C1VRR2_EUMVA|nr:hypothetical protein EVAR_30563_1 [Eumeta japonica]
MRCEGTSPGYYSGVIYHGLTFYFRTQLCEVEQSTKSFEFEYAACRRGRVCAAGRPVALRISAIYSGDHFGSVLSMGGRCLVVMKDVVGKLQSALRKMTPEHLTVTCASADAINSQTA